jgi:hypothetical protein
MTAFSTLFLSFNLYSQSEVNFAKTFFYNGTSFFSKKEQNILDRELCEGFKRNYLSFNVKNENNKILKANLNLVCNLESNQVEMILNIEEKVAVTYKEIAKASRMSDGALLFSNDKFRLQASLVNGAEEKCRLVFYDILNDHFYNGESCKFIRR